MLRIDPHTLEFALPEELIAQDALEKRDQAKLLVLKRESGEIEHRHFSDIVSYFSPGDVLVINKAKVNRARIFGKKRSGGKVELLFLGETKEKNVWRALCRPPLKAGTGVTLGWNYKAEVLGRSPDGEHLVKCDFNPHEAMEKLGKMPLPPYIKRAPADLRTKTDEEYYQTVYASAPGSVAAPTAGLHFTLDLLAQLKRHGIIIAEMVLHVGWGTFRPIAESVERHEMLAESFEFPAASMREIVSAEKDRRRIVAVVPTATRALESLPDNVPAADFAGETRIFIRPGHAFKRVGALVTNLHVPRSTPVSLTAAFAGLENLERAYDAAIKNKYRFYSYGDAMMVI
jgi:S-adenosylmethionine:tRNA ribosyltransferase-isomerase